MKGNNKSLGFTLIELIIAIVIISVLATVALPRFLKIEESAENAVLRGALGALRSTARIAESAVVADSLQDNGLVTFENKTVLMVNRFPAARANDISATGPGTFQGITSLMELDGSLALYYSDNSTVMDAASVTTVRLILALNDRCVYYQPPDTLGDLPYYSDGVLTFDANTNSCS